MPDVDLCEPEPVQGGRTGLRCKGYCHCDRHELATDAHSAVRPEPPEMHDAERELAVGPVPETERVRTVPAAGCMPVMRDGKGVLQDVSAGNICDRNRYTRGLRDRRELLRRMGQRRGNTDLFLQKEEE